MGLASDVAGDVNFVNRPGLEVFPRVSIELYDRLRFIADYRITFADAGYVGLTIGYVFGGRSK